MKSRPILFSTAMVKALLSGDKTQTRRTCKTQTQSQTDHMAYALTEDLMGADDGKHEGEAWKSFPCPYGQPGDQLKVKEAAWMWCARVTGEAKTKKTGKPKVSWCEVRNQKPIYCADHPAKPTHTPADPSPGVTYPPFYQWHKKNARFLPAWASRITLELKSARVERLQDISEEDAKAEGVTPLNGWYDCESGMVVSTPRAAADFNVDTATCPRDYRGAYAVLWDQINGPGSWAANPYVWALEFKVL
jgi:hypothetical protein